MNFNKYQKDSRKTWIFKSKHDEIRPVLGLVGESGEVAEKYKKLFRGDAKYTGPEGDYAFRCEMLKELGDVLYYIARLCDYNGFSLEEVAIYNLEKLKDRKKRKVLKGDGDNR